MLPDLDWELGNLRSHGYHVREISCWWRRAGGECCDWICPGSHLHIVLATHSSMAKDQFIDDHVSLNQSSLAVDALLSHAAKYQEKKAQYEKDEPTRTFSTKITESCFPPIAKSEEDRIPLEHCVRVYPHQQDTGGFFIAVLEKLDDIKVTPTAKPNGKVTDSSVATPKETIRVLVCIWTRPDRFISFYLRCLSLYGTGVN